VIAPEVTVVILTVAPVPAPVVVVATPEAIVYGVSPPVTILTVAIADPVIVSTFNTAPTAEPCVRLIRSFTAKPDPPPVTEIPDTCPEVTAVILKVAPVPAPEVVHVGTPVV
jgi:hypothetical protein